MKFFYTLGIIVLIAITLPLQLGIAALIAATSGCPVFFTQKRTGKNGKPFTLYKFRTMRQGAHALQNTLRRNNEAYGPVFKIYNDPRYTPIGKFLAHTGLDELPQLYNVLGGHMALFGPRPLPIAEAAKLTAWQKKRQRIRPGIMSPWILEGYHRMPFDVWMRHDVAYVQKKNWRYDVVLFFRTVSFMITLFLRECALLLAG